MDEVGLGDGAFAETVVFLNHVRELPDIRQRGKIRYPLPEVLLLCLLAVLAGAETITDIARFGEKKLNVLRRFRPFAAGTPAHDHLGDILATLDAKAFQRCFVAWVAALIGGSGGRGRHRRQDGPPLEGGGQGRHPHGVGLRRPPASCDGSGEGGRQGQEMAFIASFVTHQSVI